MDLLTLCAIIAIVFCASAASLWFINSKFRGGKTFEDVIAENRQLADKAYGSKHQKKSQRKVNANKKEKKERKPKERKEQEPESQNDSDAPSETQSASSNSPSHSHPHKGHVEFSEAEIITEEVVAAPGKQQKNKRNRKNSATKPILMNKSDPVVVAPLAPSGSPLPTEQLNHFEEIHPKDDVEIKKHKEEIQATNKKEGRKNRDKKTSPKIEKSQTIGVATVIEVVIPPPIAERDPIIESVVLAQKESPKNAPVAKEKLNKKKKNEFIAAQQQHHHQQSLVERDDINVNSMMLILGKADLTRGEIQILIDYLLNKQQDTIVNHSDWSDDIVQKLRKQLSEKERTLSEEQEATVGLQAKLREMRLEINNERMQNQSKLAAYIEELNAKRQEIQNMTQEIQFITDKHTNEKQAFGQQMQQLQSKLYQEKMTACAEATKKLQQMTEANQTVTQESFSKTHMFNDLQEKFQQFELDSATRCGDYEQKLQEYERVIRQRENEMALMAACKDEYEKIFTRQKYELEQLKIQVTEQNNKTNHLDDSSKVEIRNLQNALDSSRKELTLYTNEIKEHKMKLDECTKQIGELQASNDERLAQKIQMENDLQATIYQCKKQLSEVNSNLVTYKSQIDQQTGTIDDLQKQITEYKDKNNALIAASKVAQTPPPTPPAAAPVIVVNDDKTQQLRTKQIFDRLFPDCPAGPSNYADWLEHIDAYVEQHHKHHYNSPHNHTTINSNNLSKSSEHLNSNHLNTTTPSSTPIATTTSTINSGAGGGEDALAVDDLILQNAKLQTTVNEYKTIVAETESVLKNLENKVKEQDEYWRSIVESKDQEIQTFQTTNNVTFI